MWYTDKGHENAWLKRKQEKEAAMRVECRISADCKEPYAVLHISKITPAIAEAVSLLEKEGAGAPVLTGGKDGKTYVLDPEELELVRMEGREVVCYDSRRNRYVLSKPLYELEEVLGSRFARVSKSAIINLGRISHVEAGFNGGMELVMKNGIEDYISRSFRRSFKERLGLK